MYRGEIQNDSNGGNYNRSLDYSPSSGGLGGIGRHETRNFAVGAPLRGSGENEEMEDDPCWDGYEMIGTKMKKGREVPNCVPVGGYGERPEGATEVPNMTDFIRLFSFNNKENARKLEKTIYGEGKPFTKEQLTKIILDKNKVIADLEENAYGGDWGADFEKMIEEHNRNNQAQLFNGEGGGWQEEMFSPEEIAEAEKNWQEYLVKNPMTKGEGFWDDVRKGVVKHNERKKITPISKEDWKKQMEDFKAPTENWGADELDGGMKKRDFAKEEADLDKEIEKQKREIEKLRLEREVAEIAARRRALAAEAAPLQERAKTPPKGRGADELDGGGFFDRFMSPSEQKGFMKQIEEGNEVYQKQKRDAYNKLSDAEKLKLETDYKKSIAARRAALMEEAEQDAIKDLDEDKDKPYYEKHLKLKLRGLTREQYIQDLKDRRVRGVGEGGAAAKVEAKPSPVAAAAAALQPVRTAIQNKVGDLIYGAETDPKKQRKGLLGISEEGKEASKKKVIKNIVKPLMDGWNQLFNPDKVKEEAAARGRAEAKKAMAKAGWLYEMPDGTYDVLLGLTTDDPNAKLVRQPRRFLRWVVKNQAKNIGYWVYDSDVGAPPYIKIPNPIKGIKPNYTIDELKKNNIPFFVPVNRVNKTTDNEEVWRGLFEGDEIWVPQDNTAPVLYQRLNEFKNKMEEEKERAYYESLPEVEKREYRERKALEKDTAMTEGAKAKVEKDIADEEAKEKPDTERLAKMKAAKERVRIKGVENTQKGWTQGKQVSERIYGDNMAREAAERQAAEAKEQADNAAAFKALSPAERSAQIDAYRKDLQEQGWREEDIEDAVSQIGEQGVIAVGGAGSDDDDDDDDDDGELVGEGAIELTLLTAGQRLYNPTGDMTMANKQTFTPDYDAYGETVEQGRENAFNLSRSMYNQQQAIELPDFGLIQDNTSLRFYLKDDEDVILVGIRGTDVKSWTDLYTWAVIGAKQDFRMTTRFQDDLQKLLVFQKQYPMTEYYYVGVGSSLAGSIADRFLDMGLMDEAITYNPSIEKKYILNGNIHNHRVYLDTDPLFMLMGQYSPNTEIRKNASAANFYNPIKEKDYLIKSHSIFPVYNPAFEGGSMIGAGKTYTIEEWKAIFDAKLEKKRQQIEAREAKKKQTAKAKRERAKARRDGRDEPPPLETPATFRTSRVMKATPPKEREPEPEEEDVEMTRYKVDGNDYYVDDPREGVAFEDRVVMDMDDNELGTLADFREIAKKVMAKEKPKAPRKPRAPKAPASARVELREELVAAQPRKPEGEFASEAEPLQLVVAEIERQPQREYMRLMKSPMLTEADRRLMMSLQRSKMTPMKKVKLLARSGLARKVMEILGIDESAFQSRRARARIALTMDKRTTAAKVREIVLPEDIEAVFKAQEEGLILYVAERITKKKEMGGSLSSIMRYTETFAKCGFGCLGLTASCMEDDPFDLYYSSEMNNSIDAQGKDKEKHLTLMMALTQADENYMAQVGFWTQQTRADTSMSFGRVKHERFLLPRLTEVCMGRLEGMAGISGVSDNTRNAGMGFKRRNEWRVSFTGVSEVKKWTAGIKAEYAAKIKSEIVPKVKAIADDLKPKMLARGEVMKERLEASLTAEQKKELEDYRKGKA